MCTVHVQFFLSVCLRRKCRQFAGNVLNILLWALHSCSRHMLEPTMQTTTESFLNIRDVSMYNVHTHITFPVCFVHKTLLHSCMHIRTDVFMCAKSFFFLRRFMSVICLCLNNTHINTCKRDESCVFNRIFMFNAYNNVFYSRELLLFIILTNNLFIMPFDTPSSIVGHRNDSII